MLSFTAGCVLPAHSTRLRSRNEKSIRRRSACVTIVCTDQNTGGEFWSLVVPGVSAHLVVRERVAPTVGRLCSALFDSPIRPIVGAPQAQEASRLNLESPTAVIGALQKSRKSNHAPQPPAPPGVFFVERAHSPRSRKFFPTQLSER
jgi:hypothetical protein